MHGFRCNETMKYHWIHPEYRDAVQCFLLEESGDWMKHAVRNVIVDRTTETRKLEPPSPIPACYAKIYRYPRFKDRLRIFLRGGLFGASRAAVEYRNLRRLHRQGLAPSVIAYGEVRHHGWLQESLLVMDEVGGAVPLDQFVAGPFKAFSPEQRREFIRRLAGFTRRMNAGRFVNSEYHWRNILVRCDGAEVSFKVIDPSASRFRYRLFFPWFDLATLEVCAPYFFSRSERLLFFKCWEQMEDRPLTRCQRKRIAKIRKLSERIGRKELKRYRHILPA